MDGMDQPNFLSIDDALQKMRDGELTAEALVEACSRQIERLNPELNAFITVLRPPLSGAAGTSGKLAGIPIAVKDLFETEGITTTAGSLFFKDYVPEADAVAVQKVREAGGVIMGKTNTHEIALGVTTVNPHFGATHNPWDTARIPGGSSGGSAVAVATGMSAGGAGHRHRRLHSHPGLAVRGCGAQTHVLGASACGACFRSHGTWTISGR